MQFVVDAQLPPALATWLTDQGHAAVHAYELGLGRASDRVIWDRAIALGAVIVTTDEDFEAYRLTARANSLRGYAHGTTDPVFP
jgi:predicted nuclease of predicted toxin-antitoxin system